jgi:nicotinamidase/pyrazinamidase
VKTVFVDVDTQFDFLFPSGALYVPGAEGILPALERLQRYAAGHGISVVSTADAHAEDDPEFASWPPHCIAGTIGQHKPAATLLEKRVVAPNRAGSLAIQGARQIVVEKQTIDVFAARQIRPVLESLNPERFVVYGVVTEICVASAVRGLLALRKPVAVVEDAVRGLTPVDAARALADIRSLGATLTTVSDVCRDL